MYKLRISVEGFKSLAMFLTASLHLQLHLPYLHLYAAQEQTEADSSVGFWFRFPPTHDEAKMAFSHQQR